MVNGQSKHDKLLCDAKLIKRNAQTKRQESGSDQDLNQFLNKDSRLTNNKSPQDET